MNSVAMCDHEDGDLSLSVEVIGAVEEDILVTHPFCGYLPFKKGEELSSWSGEDPGKVRREIT